MTNDDDQQWARASSDEPQRRDSSSPEPFENLDAISFGDEGDLSEEGDDGIDEAEHKSDSTSITRTDFTEEEEEEGSFYDTRDISRIDEERGEKSDGTETEDRDSARTPSPGSYSQSTAEPASPAQSTTPIVTRTATRSGSQPPNDNDEVIVPVVVVVEEEEEEPATHEGASPAREEVYPTETDRARSSSTASFSDDNKETTYPPSLHRKTSHIDGSNGTDSTNPVPVILATNPAATSTHVPPDGGWRAWANVLGGFLVLFASLGLVSAFGVFQVYYVQISWIGSCQLCLFFLLALVAGPLFDKGHFRYLIGAGSLSVQSHWFEKRRSLAVGIVASGSSVGGICFPIMLNKLIANQDVGFATAVRAVGAVVAFSLLIANLIMSPHPARKVMQKPPRPPLKQVFTLTYTSYVIGAFILNWGMWFPNFYVQLYFQRQRASEHATYYALAIFNAGSFVGRVLPGIAADLFFGPLNMQI
ncbi:hypothetical protein C6P46_002962, partial [Rhodotorula mucilaginosa]